MKKRLSAISFLVFIFIINFASSEIIITEVMPHTNNTYGNEWIEIYNNESNNLSLVNWTIYDSLSSISSSNFSINIPAMAYGLIVDSSINCSNLNLSNSACIELSWLGSKLNDGADSVSIYNKSLIVSNFSWSADIKSSGKSWSYNGSLWLNCTPTPGQTNNCTSSAATCTQATAYGSWSACNSSGQQARTNINTSASCANTTYAETQACTYSNSSANSSLYIQLSWAAGEIINGNDFLINVSAFNLNGSYDLKIWLEFSENDTIISERYDSNSSEWKSGAYFIADFFNYTGNSAKEARLRIKDDYSSFYGEARLFAKLRKNDDIVANSSYSLTIITKSNNASSQNSSGSAENSSSSDNSKIIRLGSEIINNSDRNNVASENSIVYKSKNQLIKEGAIYGFAALCIILIILLLMDKR